jgi:hypothetical protein
MEIWNMGSFSKNRCGAALSLLLALTGAACIALPNDGPVARAFLPQCSELDGGYDAGTRVSTTPGGLYGSGLGSVYPTYGGYYGAYPSYGTYPGYGYEGVEASGASNPYGYGVGVGYTPSYTGSYGYGDYGDYGDYGEYGAWEPNYPVPYDAGIGCQN